MTPRARAAQVALCVALGVGAVPGASAQRASAERVKVLVLPLDGDADAAQRAHYTASIHRLARVLDRDAALGRATFADTATAIGCDPAQAACAEEVRRTLAVDHLVYGSLARGRDAGALTLTVRRAAAGAPPRTVSTATAPGAAPEAAEPTIFPLFQRETRSPIGERAPGAPEVVSGPAPGESGPIGVAGPDAGAAPVPAGSGSRRERPRDARTLGLVAAGGGGTLVAIGLSLWSSASRLEGTLARHPVVTRDDFDALRELEADARARAWTGNALVLAGLAVGGLGGWILYREHRARRAPRMVVVPTPIPGGGVALLWGGGAL